MSGYRSWRDAPTAAERWRERWSLVASPVRFRPVERIDIEGLRERLALADDALTEIQPGGPRPREAARFVNEALRMLVEPEPPPAPFPKVGGYSGTRDG